MNKKYPSLSLQLLVSLAMLIALSLIVGKFSLSIIPKQLVISATFVVHVIIGTIAGPIWSFVSLAAIDLIGALLSGKSNFIIWWTLMEAAQGFFYGFFFYGKKLDWHKKKDWLHVTVATLVIMLIGTFIFTPLLIQIYFKTPIAVQYAAGRWLKIFEIPIRVVITMVILPQLQRIPEFRRLAGIKQ